MGIVWLAQSLLLKFSNKNLFPCCYFETSFIFLFKGYVLYIFAILFLYFQKNIFETRKTVFLFHFLKYSSFRFLTFVTLFNGEELKNWSRNFLEKKYRFSWISWEVNTVGERIFVHLCNIIKEKCLWENSTKNVPLKLVPGLFLWSKNTL